MQLSYDLKQLSPLVLGICDTTNNIIGTGFFISNDGIIITAHHILKEPYPNIKDKVHATYNNEKVELEQLYIEPENDLAVLILVRPVFERKINLLSTDYQLKREHLAFGYHRQDIFNGPVDICLQTMKNQATSVIRFSDGREIECLILDPEKDSDIPLPGMSGAPLYDMEIKKIIGFIIGSSIDIKSMASLLIPGRLGFAVSFNQVLMEFKPLRSLLEGKKSSLIELFEVYNEDELWIPRVGKINSDLLKKLRRQYCEKPKEPALSNKTRRFSELPYCFSSVIKGEKGEFQMLERLVTHKEYFEFTIEVPYWGRNSNCIADKKVDSSYLENWTTHCPDKTIEDLPINFICYNSAIAFIEWFSMKYNKNARIPYIDEWEFAAKAGREENWVEDEMNKRRVNFDGILNHSSDAFRALKNPYHIADLFGNLSDLCIDRNDPNTIKSCGGHYKSIKYHLWHDRPLLDFSDCRSEVSFRLVIET